MTSNWYWILAFFCIMETFFHKKFQFQWDTCFCYKRNKDQCQYTIAIDYFKATFEENLLYIGGKKIYLLNQFHIIKMMKSNIFFGFILYNSIVNTVFSCILIYFVYTNMCWLLIQVKEYFTTTIIYDRYFNLCILQTVPRILLS